MKPIIFDFDGVIIDSQQHWDTLSMEHLQKLMPNWTMEDDRKLKGHSAKDNYAMLIKEYHVTFTYDQFIDHVSEIAEEVYREHAQLTPGVQALLTRIQAITPDLPSIASASRLKWLDIALDRFNLRNSFGFISTTEEVECGKPYPDVYLKAAEKINQDPTQCIAVEDTNVGLQAAKDAGMFCIGFHAPDHEHQELAAADLHIEHFDELTEDVLRRI